jgi:signal transduction histidine kinase
MESVQKAIEELQLKAKEKSLDLAFVAPTAPLLPVFADPDHVYRVLINLIGNSIKYTARGWVRCFVTQYDQKQLLFTITDSGLGIPEENQPHLFEKFYRADRKDIAGIQGTGLGLYISKKIVELMGGQMWVESTVGKGTTFYFTVPIQQPGDHATTIEPQPVQQSTSQLTRR